MEEWINPALLELCERQEPLSLDEARLMDFEDVVLVGSVRQTVRSSDLVVDGAGIREHIQAWGSEEPSSPVSEPSDICTLSVGPQSPPLDWAPSPPLATPNTIFTHPPLDFSSQPAGSSSLFGGNTVSETTESFPWPAPSKKTKRGKKKKVSIFQ
jgi:hypothetical protein